MPGPICLHPDNPHYFLFNDRPTVLITSGEHYGAVLNLDFDYLTYLDELERYRLNLTRIFAGTYRELPGTFEIELNTLAPAPGRYLAPWASIDTPDGEKFDLTTWNAAFFTRLQDIISNAGSRGIVVEVTLFCTFYSEELWHYCPMHVSSNINGIGDVPREEALTLHHPDLLAVQEAFVRKVVDELRGHDNLYYEICNEPYSPLTNNARVPDDWQRHIAAVIADAEQDLPQPHLIAQNIDNGSTLIDDPDPHVSIFNFHYCYPPEAVGMNYHLNRPIGFDETGFAGSADSTYRRQAWQFLCAGGSLFNNLDYSFTVAHPDGTAVQSAPGGGSRALRQQLAFLLDVLADYDLPLLAPADHIILGGIPDGAMARVLGRHGKAYLLHLDGGSHATLRLNLPAGLYTIDWLHPRTGDATPALLFPHAGGPLPLTSPLYEEDIALRIITEE